MDRNCFVQLLAIAAIFGASSINGYRILGLFPHPGISHFQFFHPVMKALADVGHDVTVVSHFPNKEEIANYKDESLTGKSTMVNFVNLDWFAEPKPYEHLLEFFMLHEWGQEACEHALNSSAIKNVLNIGRREPYDLIIVEQFNTDCMLGVAHKLEAPIIGLSSCNIMPWHFPRVGLPYEPGFFPTTFTGGSDKMTFPTRLSNWFTLVYMNFMYHRYNDAGANKALKQRFGAGMPDISELSKKISLMFVNQHYSLSGAKHLPPSVIELGGIHIQKPKTMDPEIQDLLDTADNGVVYISWGSMVKADTLSEEKRESILHALGKLKQRVLWKWENDTLPNQPPNVFIRKWMPQREILCHPKVRVFMTHGGLLGSSEAAYCGVPVITTPFYGDQFLNSAALEDRGMAVILKFQDINKDTVFAALRKALEPKMKANAKKVAYSYTHRPLSPVESAVFWSEYVISTGGAQLARPHSADSHWLVYSMLDIYLFILAVLSITIGSWIYLFKKIFGQSKQKKMDQKKDHSFRAESMERKIK